MPRPWRSGKVRAALSWWPASLLLAGWLAFYFLLFIPRGAVG
jgi:hypothetical protein